MRLTKCKTGVVIAILSAPSNLGLRPPVPGGVPGASKAPEALRAAGLYERFAGTGGRDSGVVLPGRYVDDDASRPPGHVRNERAIIDHSRQLATRVHSILNQGDAPLVVGGDCSILIGAGLALVDRGAGLVHLDGHTDFRHPGNSDQCASVAGEDLAAVVGMHWPAIADIDGRRPYFSPKYVAHVGCRDNDDVRAEAASALGSVISAQEAIVATMPTTAATAAAAAGDTGYWLHLDVDILDPEWMPAVDSPDAGGLSPDQLGDLLTVLAPSAIGASVTVFDPDLDPSGEHAALLVDVLSRGLPFLGAGDAGICGCR